MLVYYYLSTALFFSTVVTAAPPSVLVSKSPISLALSRRINTTSIHNLARHDKRRANGFRFLQSAPKSGTFSSRKDGLAGSRVPVDNQAVIYTAKITTGTPATEYTLIVDTGSSNTWIGAGKGYLPTASKSVDLVEVHYGSGSFFGAEFTDKVCLSPEVCIDDQSIGSAIVSEGFEGFDGILGIGPPRLTVGTQTIASHDEIPTVVDNLFSQQKIPRHEVGIYFEATNSKHPTSNGELTFGGTDESKHGPITYVPITETKPAGYYWGIDQSVKYGDTILLPQGSSGIVDTGTTQILMASDAFNKYIELTGAVRDSPVGLPMLSLSQYGNLANLTFIIGGTEFSLIPDAQIWPRQLNTAVGGTTSAVYLIVGDIGTISGAGIDFVNGYAFLERFYSVYDSANECVGIAETAVTRKTINYLLN